jgi:hypothetical protein
MATNINTTTIVTETETLVTVGSAAANRVNYFHIVKKFTKCSFTLPGLLELACKLIESK